jgi:membrane-associated phospholipid phosphatase
VPQRVTAVALVGAVGSVLVVVVLAWIVSSHNAIVDADHTVARWSVEHAGDFGRRAVHAVTRLGTSKVALVALGAVAIVQLIRKPSMRLALFVGTVELGVWLMVPPVKDLVGRTRPSLAAAAGLVDPSFPSGHATNAAACYTAMALVLGIGCTRTTRATLLGVAAFVAVAVAASRVLLTVHWFTDTLGGLALGWAWCALCVAAFGRGLFDRPRARSQTSMSPTGSAQNWTVR